MVPPSRAPAFLLLFVVCLPACGGAAGEGREPEAPRDADRLVAPPLEPTAARALGASVQTALGVPKDDDASDDYLMDKGEYVVSYNPARRVPNWVSWKLDTSD